MLKQFSKNYCKVLSLLLCATLSVAFGFAQQTNRNGVVKDSHTNSGLAGVTVAVREPRTVRRQMLLEPFRFRRLQGRCWSLLLSVIIRKKLSWDNPQQLRLN